MAGASLLRTRTSKKRANALLPYIFHFGIFVVVFFSIIGGALFVLNIASAYTP